MAALLPRWLALAALCAVAACGLVDVVAEQKGEEAVDIAGAVQVDLVTFNGSVEVSAGAAGKVAVAWTKRGSGATQKDAEADLANVEVKVVSEKGRVRVIARRTDGRSANSSGASFVVAVPPKTPVTLGSSNGSLAVRGLGAAVAAKTSNGAVRVEGAQGEVSLDSSNGSVHLSGEAILARVKTSNGAVRFEGSLAPGSSALESLNGSIEASLPAQARFLLSAHTSNGGVQCDFPLGQVTESGRRDLAGTVGSAPDASLSLRTSNGEIRVRSR